MSTSSRRPEYSRGGDFYPAKTGDQNLAIDTDRPTRLWSVPGVGNAIRNSYAPARRAGSDTSRC